MRSNIASVIGRIVDNPSDSDESDDETDSSDGLENFNWQGQDRCEETLNTNSNITVRSLLTVLKAPKQSDLTRKRKVVVNPPKDNGSVRVQQPTKGLASVKPLQRSYKFPNKSLVISNGKLFTRLEKKEI